MATYKVLQDIEAEDKLLGPLTLKQFIFAIITIGIGFVNFKLATASELNVVRWPFVIALLLPMAIFGFLAAPISRDQPNDIWLLARLRFIVRPHRRIWNQDGVSNLVTITVPKRLEEVLTDGLTQTEVKSRLSALANTLDSRGWAVKNVNTNLYSEPGYIDNGESDRLVGPASLPQDVPQADVAAADDIFDIANNQASHQLDELVQASMAQHRQAAIAQTQPQDSTQVPADYWFMNQNRATPGAQQQIQEDFTTFSQQQVVLPGSPTNDDGNDGTSLTAADDALLSTLQHNKAVAQPLNGHLRNLQPLHDREGNLVQRPQQSVDTATLQAHAQAPDQSVKPETVTPNPAIMGLAQNNDLNVATIARQAKEIKGDDEVVISLR
jgi:hypothetical protein